MSDQDDTPEVGSIHAQTVVVAKNLKISGGLHAGTSQPSTLPQVQRNTAHLRLPPRRPKFVGRDDILRRIHELLTANPRTGTIPEVALVGQGGIGKTSLAVEYGWEHAHDYPGGVFFIDCSTGNVLEALGGPPVLGSNGASIDPDASIEAQRAKAQQFRDTINARNQRSLLIIDNLRSNQDWEDLKKSGLLPAGLPHLLLTSTDADLSAAEIIRLRGLSVVRRD